MSTIQLYPTDSYNQQLLDNVIPEGRKNPVPTGRYNLIVIGGGSAGLVAAIGAAGVGGKVALVESHLLGGDCLNVGCVPSKTIIRSAKLFEDLRRGAALGIDVADGSKADFAKVMERMRRIRSEISDFDSVERIESYGIDLFLGNGQFTGANSMTVTGHDGSTADLTFAKAIIATGSSPAAPPIPGLAETGFITNIETFELTAQPRRLAVIGAGPIGVELAQTFQRFGSDVTLFDMAPQVLSREDQDAARIIEGALLRDGMTLQLGVSIKQVSTVAEGKQIAYEREGVTAALTVDEILVATGRRPNLDSLNLEAAGVEFDRKGLTVNDRLQTTNRHIYGAGDVASKYQFTHTANAMARIAVQNALFFGRKKMSNLIIPWVTFSDPEVAHVGMYADEAEEQGVAIDTYMIEMSDTDRGRADGENEGFVKIHTRKGSDKIVGATIVARHAGEMISEITLAMVAGLGLKSILSVIHPYPTQSEAIRKAADEYNRTRLTPLVKRIFETVLAWRR